MDNPNGVDNNNCNINMANDGMAVSIIIRVVTIIAVVFKQLSTIYFLSLQVRRTQLMTMNPGEK